MKGWVSGRSPMLEAKDDEVLFAEARLAVDFFLLVDFFVGIPPVYTLVFKIRLNYNKRNNAKTNKQKVYEHAEAFTRTCF
jgi:hypothetical protein